MIDGVIGSPRCATDSAEIYRRPGKHRGKSVSTETWHVQAASCDSSRLDSIQIVVLCRLATAVYYIYTYPDRGENVRSYLFGGQLSIEIRCAIKGNRPALFSPDLAAFPTLGALDPRLSCFHRVFNSNETCNSLRFAAVIDARAHGDARVSDRGEKSVAIDQRR